MKTTIYFKSFILILFFCSFTLEKDQENDWTKMNLNGKVASIEMNHYHPIVTSDSIRKGKRMGQSYQVSSTLLFNEDGFLTSNLYYFYDSEYYRESVYSYKANNQLNEIHLLSEKNGVPYGKYVVSSNTKKMKKIDYYYEGDKKETETSHYNKDGKLAKFEKQFYSYNSIETETFFYNENGLLDSLQQIDSASQFGLSRRFEYNKKGLISFKKGYNLTSLEPDFYHTYEYDQHNNIIKKEYFDDDELESSSTFKYKYDSQGNWIVKIEKENGRYLYYLEREITYY